MWTYYFIRHFPKGSGCDPAAHWFILIFFFFLFHIIRTRSFRNFDTCVRVSIIIIVFMFLFYYFLEFGGRFAGVRQVGGMQQGGHVSMAVGGEAVQVSARRAAVFANAVAGWRTHHHRQNEAIQGKDDAGLVRAAPKVVIVRARRAAVILLLLTTTPRHRRLYRLFFDRSLRFQCGLFFCRAYSRIYVEKRKKYLIDRYIATYIVYPVADLSNDTGNSCLRGNWFLGAVLLELYTTFYWKIVF